MDNLSERIDSFIEKQEKVYLLPGEKPPKGAQVQRGPRGGLFYIKYPKEFKEIDEKRKDVFVNSARRAYYNIPRRFRDTLTVEGVSLKIVKVKPLGLGPTRDAAYKNNKISYFMRDDTFRDLKKQPLSEWKKWFGSAENVLLHEMIHNIYKDPDNIEFFTDSFVEDYHEALKIKGKLKRDLFANTTYAYKEYFNPQRKYTRIKIEEDVAEALVQAWKMPQKFKKEKPHLYEVLKKHHLVHDKKDTEPTIYRPPLGVERIHRGSSIELLRGRYGNKGSVSFGRDNIPDAIKNFRVAYENRKLKETKIGFTKVKGDREGLVMSDYQGRKLKMPYEEIPTMINALREEEKQMREEHERMM